MQQIDIKSKINLLITKIHQIFGNNAINNNYYRTLKDVSKDVVDRAGKILSAVMKRISEAFDYILKLGEQMLQGFLNFFGLNISNVTVEGGGKYPLL